jgi:hypothetical protein
MYFKLHVIMTHVDHSHSAKAYSRRKVYGMLNIQGLVYTQDQNITLANLRNFVIINNHIGVDDG